MLKIIYYIVIVFSITSAFIWIIENNGTITINWLEYEIQTDILTVLILTLFLIVFVTVFSYILTRILSIKFPRLKLFFKKNHIQKLEEKILHYDQGFDLMTKLLLAIEAEDFENAKIIHNNFKNHITFQNINEFFHAKFAFNQNNYDLSQKIFTQFKDNPHSLILALRSQLKNALKNNDEKKSIEFAQKILTLRKDNISTARELLQLYKKNGEWQSAMNLIKDFGSENIEHEHKNLNSIIINSSSANEAFENKKYFKAIKLAKKTLGFNNKFLPAYEIIIKSLIKLKLNFIAILIIKSQWKKNPHIIFVEFFNIIYRKNSPKTRLKAITKLTKLNSDLYYTNYALGLIAFRSGQYKIAKNHFEITLTHKKSQKIYQLLAYCEKFLDNKEEFYKNITIAKTLPKISNYICKNCQKTYSKWQCACNDCINFGSLQSNS